MKNIFVALLAIISIACSKGTAEEPFTQPPDPETSDPNPPQNKVVAHRGAWQEFNLPDNSLAALKKAIEIGAYATEIDVHLTKDKKVIVYHDETIGGQYFKDVNYAEIQNRTLSNGEVIPTLEVVIDEILKHNTTLLWIDLKSLSDNAGGNTWGNECAKAVAAVIKDKKAEKNVRAIVGRKAVLDASILASQNSYEHGYMNTDYTPSQFTTNGYKWANFSYSKFYTNANTHNAALIQQYVDAGLKVSVYTVDDATIQDWFLAQPGVFAITTNKPFALLQKIKNN